jgi:hypothetical protein
MKVLVFRNKIAARPSSAVAAPQHRQSNCFAGANSPATPAKAVPQWREVRLPPWVALAAILAAITIALCEPASLIGWIKALAGAVIVPGGAFAIVKTATGEWRIE